jgi:hypothetical protein
VTKVKRPEGAPYSARDRRDAARVLRAARSLLTSERDPFPVLEAARRVGVSTSSRAWELAAQARDDAGGPRDERQLRAAADLGEGDWSPGGSPSPRLTRVPRCRLPAEGGRCARPVDHGRGCALDPSPDDLVRSVGAEHVLVGGPPTGTTMVVAWEAGEAGGSVRVRRDDHDRGLWVDYPSTQRVPLLLGWPGVRRLALDLNLELAERRGATTGQPPAGLQEVTRRRRGKKKSAP